MLNEKNYTFNWPELKGSLQLAENINATTQTGIIKNITKGKGENEFHVRMLKDDGVGFLTTTNDNTGLLVSPYTK